MKNVTSLYKAVISVFPALGKTQIETASDHKINILYFSQAV